MPRFKRPKKSSGGSGPSSREPSAPPDSSNHGQSKTNPTNLGPGSQGAGSSTQETVVHSTPSDPTEAPDSNALGIFFNKKEAGETPSNEPLQQSQSTAETLEERLNRPLERKEEPQQPETSDNSGHNKESDQTQVPTSQYLNPQGNTDQPNLLISPNPQAPIFFHGSSAQDARFEPYLELDDPIEGESQVDITIRDQIRRSEAVLERPLTDREKKVILSYFRDMGGQYRAPHEVSEPAVIHSPPPPPPPPPPMQQTVSIPETQQRAQIPIANPAAASAAATAAHGEAGMRYRVQSLLDRLSEVEENRTADRYLTETLVEDISRLKRDKQTLARKILALEKQLKETQGRAASDINQLKEDKKAAARQIAGLEWEMEGFVREMSELRGDMTSEKGEESEQGSTKGDSADRKVHRPQVWERNYAPGRRILRAGWFPLLAVVVCLAALVLFVTEAVLHSKRLSDGYGAIVNGGYNGLASVVIFGTWSRFLLYNVVVLYLGVFSVLAALGW